jgi:hypothetical protein
MSPLILEKKLLGCATLPVQEQGINSISAQNDATYSQIPAVSSLISCMYDNMSE